MTELQQSDKAVAVATSKLERHHWRMGLAASARVSSSAYRLATVVENFMNDQSGEAWPEQETLASLSAMSVRQVREHLSALSQAGWLVTLSGKDRTKPRTRRGLHYRPMWPDLATKERCLDRNYADIRTGGIPPVSKEVETGDPALQKRKSRASIPAVQGINTGGNPPLSYEDTYDPTQIGRGSSRAPDRRVERDNGPLSAYAERSDPADIDVLAGFAEPDLDHPPAWLAEAPSPVDDLAGYEPFSEVENTSSADARSVPAMLALCVERDDDLKASDSLWIDSLEGRKGGRFTADEIARLERIVGKLQENDDLNFDDEAAEETREGAR